MAFRKGIQSATLKQYDVKIEGKWISPIAITSLQIKNSIDDFTISGILNFYDRVNLVEIIKYGSKIEVSLTDFSKNQYNHSFIIVGANYSRNENGDIVAQIYFEDKLALQLKKMYPIKGFDSPKTLIDIVTDVDTAKSVFKSKEQDFCSLSTKFKTFVVPRHKSFFWTVNYLKKKSNCYVFQTQKKIKIKQLKDLTSQSKKIKYKYRTNNQLSKENAFDFKIDYNNEIKNIIYTPDLDISFFNPEKKQLQKFNESFKSSTSKFPFDDIAPNFNTKKKEVQVPDLFSKNEFDFLYNKKISENFKLELLTLGNFKIEAGDIIEFDIPSLLDKKSPEANLSGKYLIKEIIYNINESNFIQKIIGIKAKNKKPFKE